MEQKRIRTYVLYAAGEILLVVIGILIALQVNNWNEERKQQNEIEALLTDVEGALERRLTFLRGNNNMAKNVDSIITVVLSKNFNREMAAGNPELAVTFLNNDFFSVDITSFLRSDTYTNAILRESEFPTVYGDFIAYLKLMTETLTSLSKNADRFRDYMTQNEFYVMNNHPYLLLDDEESQAKSIDFALNDPAYRARVVGYKNQFDRLFIDLVWLRANHLKAFTELKLKKDAYSVPQVDSLWAEQDLTRLTSTECKDSFEPVGIDTDSLYSPSFTAIYNSTDQEIKASFFIEQNPIEISINPGQLVFLFLPQETPFRYERDGTCNLFQTGIQNGYFIVE